MILDSIIRLEVIDNQANIIQASGIILSKDCVLTAAHVLNNSKRIYAIIGQNKIFLQNKFIHKDFDYLNYGYNDIALCFAKNNFYLNEYPKLYTSNDEIGKNSKIYGFTSNKHKDTIQYMMYQSDANVYDCERTVLMCEHQKNNTSKVGTSGGALVIDNKIAGVNSLVIELEAKVVSCHTRVSQMYEWISSYSIY